MTNEDDELSGGSVRGSRPWTAMSPETKCAVRGCGNKPGSRGLCQRHRKVERANRRVVQK